MRKLWLPLVAALAFVAVAVAGWYWKRAPGMTAVDCADPVRGCTFIHKGLPVELRFSIQPKPFEPFRMGVVAPAARKVSVEFQMAGMDMGFNRHDLHPGRAGQFGGEVSQPAGVTGRHSRQATLALDENRYTFIFRSRE